MTPKLHDLNTPARILLGPGPSIVHPRVLRTMATALVGYLDPKWFDLMDQEQALLRDIFKTANEMTLPLTGTGSAGMEASFCNFVEPGDTVVVGCNGYFSDRMCEMARRYGANVKRIEKPWGSVFTVEEIVAALKENRSAKIFALVHAETSTGVLQPLTGIGDAVHKNGTLFLLDCVTSLGGIPLDIDAQGVDIAYSASQKCLGCPPGLSPFSASERAVKVLHSRKTTVPNWYLDLTLIEKYWNSERVYHHTPSTTLHYGLREGLRIVLEEGLEPRWQRHQRTAEYLWDKIEVMGLRPFVPRSDRLASLTTIMLPEGIDEGLIRKRLLDEYNIEIAGGFGPLKGKIWRVGLMGHSCRRENVALLAEALRELLRDRL